MISLGRRIVRCFSAKSARGAKAGLSSRGYFGVFSRVRSPGSGHKSRAWHSACCALGAPSAAAIALFAAVTLGAAPTQAADNFAVNNATGTFTVIRCTDSAGVCTLNVITTPSGTGSESVVSIAGTTGGATASFLQPTASDNHATIKNGAGTLYGAIAFNNSVTINYLRYYNLGTGFNGCNSATGLIAQFQIPPSGGYSIQLPVGIAFSTGLSICVTSGYATTDTTNATASAMSITTLYN